MSPNQSKRLATAASHMAEQNYQKAFVTLDKLGAELSSSQDLCEVKNSFDQLETHIYQRLKERVDIKTDGQRIMALQKYILLFRAPMELVPPVWLAPGYIYSELADEMLGRLVQHLNKLQHNSQKKWLNSLNRHLLKSDSAVSGDAKCWLTQSLDILTRLRGMLETDPVNAKVRRYYQHFIATISDFIFNEILSLEPSYNLNEFDKDIEKINFFIEKIHHLRRYYINQKDNPLSLQKLVDSEKIINEKLRDIISHFYHTDQFKEMTLRQLSNLKRITSMSNTLDAQSLSIINDSIVASIEMSLNKQALRLITSAFLISTLSYNSSDFSMLQLIEREAHALWSQAGRDKKDFYYQLIVSANWLLFRAKATLRQNDADDIKLLSSIFNYVFQSADHTALKKVAYVDFNDIGLRDLVLLTEGVLSQYKKSKNKNEIGKLSYLVSMIEKTPGYANKVDLQKFVEMKRIIQANEPQRRPLERPSFLSMCQDPQRRRKLQNAIRVIENSPVTDQENEACRALQPVRF